MTGTMSDRTRESFDLLVIGAGPAGVVASLHAARLGARTVLVTREAFGGMAANDGPVPVRTLAHAARLMREARQLPSYGITTGEPTLDYLRLLDRVHEVTDEVRARSLLRGYLHESGVTVHENAGPARFIDAHAVKTDEGLQLRAGKVILCTGGAARRLELPGVDLTCTHSDAWALSSTPASMLVIGAGATGVQLASIFNAFGSRVTLYEAAPRILMSEDEEVAAAVSAALQASGIQVLENAGTIERFDPCPAGVRMIHSYGGGRNVIDTALVVIAVGWIAHTAELDLTAAGVHLDQRGYVKVDSQLRTSAPHIFAAGDVTGRLMVVHEAVREGYLAAANAVLGEATALPPEVSPLGSFTDPEYASVGLTEAAARQSREIVVARQSFGSLPRPIIDGRTTGFCKLVADRRRHTILGCHIVGERAVELAQLAAIAIAVEMTIDQLALVPFSFPTYASALGRAAVLAVRELEPTTGTAQGSFADEAGVA